MLIVPLFKINKFKSFMETIKLFEHPCIIKVNENPTKEEINKLKLLKSLS